MSKSAISSIILLSVLLISHSEIHAQTVYNMYVSKQYNKYTKFTGSYSKTTDKFEHGSVSPSTTGPISYTVSPTDLSIDTNESKTWTGELYPNIAAAPAPGSSATASLSGAFSLDFKKFGVLTHVDTTITRNFKIHTLNITAPDTLYIPADNKTQITAVGYPAGGAYRWKSTDPGISVDDSTSATPVIKGVPVNKLSSIWVQYSFDSIRVTKKIFIQGYKILVNLIDPETGKNSNKPICDGKNGSFGIKVVPPSLTDMVLASITSITPTIAVTPGATNNGNVIGHTNMPVHLQAGETTKWDFGPAFWYSNRADHCNDVCHYELTFATNVTGLPAGISIPKKDIRVSASFDDCINGHANFKMAYPPLNFQPPLSFVPDPTNPNVMRMVADTGKYPTLVITKTFARNGRFTGYSYKFEIANFKFSDVEIGIKTPTTSQFYNMTVAEEAFHKNQFNGIGTSITLLQNLPTAQQIVNAVNNDLAGYRNNNAAAGALVASNRFKNKIIAAVNLTNAMLAYGHNMGLRCALEKEAKDHVTANHGNMFKAGMPCAYPGCK